MDGKLVQVRRLPHSDEGVLYTMQISTRRKKAAASSLSWRTSWRRGWRDWKFCKKKSKAEGPETNTLWAQRSFRLGAKDAQFTIRKKKKYVS